MVKINTDKQLRVSDVSHKLLSLLSKREGLSIKDYIERLSLVINDKDIYIDNLVSFSNSISQLLEQKISLETDRIIKLLRVYEKDFFIPTKRDSSKTLMNVLFVSKTVEQAQNPNLMSEEIDNIPYNTKHETEESINTDMSKEYQIELERFQIKLQRAKECLSNIIADNKMAKSSIGTARTRRFEASEIEEIKALINDL